MSLLSLTAYKLILATGKHPRSAIGRVQPSDLKEALALSIGDMNRREQIELVRTLFASQPVEAVLEAVDEVITLPPLIFAYYRAPRIAQAKGVDRRITSALAKPKLYESEESRRLAQAWMKYERHSDSLRESIKTALNRVAIILDNSTPEEALEVLSVILGESASNDAMKGVSFALSKLPGGMDALESAAIEGVWSAYYTLQDRIPEEESRTRLMRIAAHPETGDYVRQSVIHHASGKSWGASEAWMKIFRDLMARPQTPANKYVHTAIARQIASSHMGDPGMVEWAMTHANRAVMAEFALTLPPGHGDLAMRLAKVKVRAVQKAVFSGIARHGAESALRLLDHLLTLKDSHKVGSSVFGSLAYPGGLIHYRHKDTKLPVALYEQLLEGIMASGEGARLLLATRKNGWMSLMPDDPLTPIRQMFLYRLKADPNPEIRKAALDLEVKCAPVLNTPWAKLRTA